MKTLLFVCYNVLLNTLDVVHCLLMNIVWTLVTTTNICLLQLLCFRNEIICFCSTLLWSYLYNMSNERKSHNVKTNLEWWRQTHNIMSQDSVPKLWTFASVICFVRSKFKIKRQVKSHYFKQNFTHMIEFLYLIILLWTVSLPFPFIANTIFLYSKCMWFVFHIDSLTYQVYTYKLLFFVFVYLQITLFVFVYQHKYLALVYMFLFWYFKL